jgi:hypothetical protein
VAARIPLTLRLAARAVGQFGAGALDSDGLQRAIARAEIDGYLHARVLAHLPSSRLARVGRTALLLRELTPGACWRSSDRSSSRRSAPSPRLASCSASLRP